MKKRSEKSKPSYAARIAQRKRLRAVLGWGVPLRDLSEEERKQAETRAAEPLARLSLIDLAEGASARPEPPKLALIFKAGMRASLLDGTKSSTIRKKSSHTARFKPGVRVRVEAPKGVVIGEAAITGVVEEPNLTKAERAGVRAIYGASPGALVRLVFDKVR